jgi:hypothetical protein
MQGANTGGAKLTHSHPTQHTFVHQVRLRYEGMSLLFTLHSLLYE